MSSDLPCPSSLLQAIDGLANRLLVCESDANEIGQANSTKEVLAQKLRTDLTRIAQPKSDDDEDSKFSTLVPLVGSKKRQKKKKRTRSTSLPIQIGEIWQKIVCGTWVLGCDVTNLSNHTIYGVSIYVASLEETGIVTMESSSKKIASLNSNQSGVLMTKLQIPSFAFSHQIRAHVNLTYTLNSNPIIVSCSNPILLSCIDVIGIKLSANFLAQKRFEDAMAFCYVMKVERLRVTLSEVSLVRILIEALGINPIRVKSSQDFEFRLVAEENESLRNLVIATASELDSTLLEVYFAQDNCLAQFLAHLVSHVRVQIFPEDDAAAMRALARTIEGESQARSAQLQKTVSQWKDLSTTISVRQFIDISDRSLAIQRQTDASFRDRDNVR